MALWRVLDLYKRDASRRGQALAKQLTYLGNFTPKKSFAKNNTNSDLFSEFVLFAYGGHLFDKFEQTAEKETRCNESGVSSGGIGGVGGVLFVKLKKISILSLYTIILLTSKLSKNRGSFFSVVFR